MKPSCVENQIPQPPIEVLKKLGEAAVEQIQTKSILFIDFYYLYRTGANFNELITKLELEWDEIRIYEKYPDEHQAGYNDLMGAIKFAVKTGLPITLYPSNVEPVLTMELMNSIQRPDVKKIAILSGNAGYYEALRHARNTGKDVTVILSNEHNAWLLRRIGNQCLNVEDFFKNEEEPLIRTEVN